MGCVLSQSRFESRNLDLDDYNQLDAAFIGGDGRPLEKDLCPVDKIFLNYNIEMSKQGRNGTGGWAKETVEIFNLDKNGDIADDSEEVTRARLKAIISFFDGMKAHIEREGRRKQDYKKILIGQKYETGEVLDQLDRIL